MTKPCTCTPGEPKPPPGETWRDLVDVEGLTPEDAAILVAAANEALRREIEPGIRRVRFIEGFLAGYMAATHEDKSHQPTTDALLQQARDLIEGDYGPED